MDRTNKPEQFLILTDAWSVIRKYLNADDVMCNEVKKDMDEFYSRYKNPFAKEIAIACLNEIDRIMKRNTKEKDNGETR